MKIDKGLSPVGWRSLAVPSGVESDLPGTTPGLRLTVFPGGNLLAYDDGGADPSIYLYDLATQEEEKLATDVAGPRFVSDGALLGTRTEPCDPDGGCFVAWDSLGEGLRVFLGAPPIAQSFASSLDADII
jgi:hypothetical protein